MAREPAQSPSPSESESDHEEVQSRGVYIYNRVSVNAVDNWYIVPIVDQTIHLANCHFFNFHLSHTNTNINTRQPHARRTLCFFRKHSLNSLG